MCLCYDEKNNKTSLVVIDDEEGLLKDIQMLVRKKIPLKCMEKGICAKIEGVLKINYEENTLRIIF